jgi:stage II sporulation protein R
VVEVITPLLVNCNNKEEVINIINVNKQLIERTSNEILSKNSFSYNTKVVIKKEYFPTRIYDDVVLQSGTYDAIILELGNAEGNNWWCVVYPPLCFVNQTGSTNIVYKSKLLEIIEKFFK